MADGLDAARIEQLLEAGDFRQAAEVAIRQHGEAILRHLQGMLKQEDDARDALSLWAESVWKGLPGFRRECSLRVWSYRLARNAALKLRDEAWRKRGRRLLTTEASRLAEQVRRSSMMLQEARAEKVARLREALEPEERELLALRLDQGLSFKEVAEVLAGEGEEPPTEAALRQRFGRIKEKLARMAREAGLLE